MTDPMKTVFTIAISPVITIISMVAFAEIFKAIGQEALIPILWWIVAIGIPIEIAIALGLLSYFTK